MEWGSVLATLETVVRLNLGRIGANERLEVSAMTT